MEPFTYLLLKPAMEIAIDRASERIPEFKVSWAAAMHHQQTVRVSVAVLLQIVDEDGMVLLIRNAKRPSLYAPIGGVIRTLEQQPAALKAISFLPESVGEGKAPGESRDLRGIIKGKHLAQFVDWFARGGDRETYRQAMVRELVEEIRESGGECSSAEFAEVDFHTVRTCVELPFWPNPNEKTYLQFRWLEIVEPHSPRCRETVLRILSRSRGILKASPKEVRDGMASGGEAIAPSADYLVGPRRMRQEPPAYKT